MCAQTYGVRCTMHESTHGRRRTQDDRVARSKTSTDRQLTHAACVQSKPNLARVGDDNTASMRCTPSREQAHHDRRVANRCIALHNTTQTTAAQRRWSNTVGRVRASPTMHNAACTSAACACTHAETCTTPTQHTRSVLSVCTSRDPSFSAHTRHRAESRFSHRAARNHVAMSDAVDGGTDTLGCDVSPTLSRAGHLAQCRTPATANRN